MDAETSRRISELASNLKKMHLATTMEEAVQRATEIIQGSKCAGGEKPIKDLLGASKKQEQKKENVIVEAADRVVREDVALDRVKEELSGMHDTQQAEAADFKEKIHESHETFSEDTEQHKQEAADTEQLKKDVARKKQAVDDAEDIVQMAEKVQKS